MLLLLFLLLVCSLRVFAALDFFWAFLSVYNTHKHIIYATWNIFYTISCTQSLITVASAAFLCHFALLSFPSTSLLPSIALHSHYFSLTLSHSLWNYANEMHSQLAAFAHGRIMWIYLRISSAFSFWCYYTNSGVHNSGRLCVSTERLRVANRCDFCCEMEGKRPTNKKMEILIKCVGVSVCVSFCH